MNKHHFKVAFNPIDPNAGLKGAKRRKSIHRYAYKIVPTDSLPPKVEQQIVVSNTLVVIVLSEPKPVGPKN
ncbi:unnamed protein product [Strongylus vulgaris]|uniref:Uncharacterized protein n=1 Tax=Strongylus vulgaris TaxID=40348 RepID=A0A3P7HZY9_STRVU|nr:unnamed protein product [Strongylus vulgaris]